MHRRRQYPRDCRARLGGVLLLASLLWGCQSTTRLGDYYYAEGRYPEAAAAYEVYLDAGMSDTDQTVRTLYRLAVILATPGSAAYDPRQSIEILDRLISSYPGNAHTPEAVLLRKLQTRIVDQEAELTVDRVRLTELEVDLAERERELAELQAQVGEKDDQIQALQDSIPPLQIEIRHLIHELADKQQELEQLERLKAIDLDQPPP